MTDVPSAEIVSFDLATPDHAVLTYTVHGATCRIAFGFNHVGVLRLQSSRVRHAMEAARTKSMSEGGET